MLLGPVVCALLAVACRGAPVTDTTRMKIAAEVAAALDVRGRPVPRDVTVGDLQRCRIAEVVGAGAYDPARVAATLRTRGYKVDVATADVVKARGGQLDVVVTPDEVGVRITTSRGC